MSNDICKECLGGERAFLLGEIIHKFEQTIESPIERKFLIGFLEVMNNAYISLEEPDEGVFIATVRPGVGWKKVEVITLAPQVKIGRYRADFVASFFEGTDLKISTVVECDGHDYHHATKEQVDRDNKKSSAIQEAGYSIMRFSGSRLYRDSYECASEVVSFLIKKGRE